VIRISRRSAFFVLVCFLAVLSIEAAGQLGASYPNTIGVSGSAEVRVPPDEVILAVGVETADKNLSVAKALNDQKIASALAVTRKFGISPSHVQTDYIRIEPRHRNGEIFSELLGYVVRKSIVVRFDDIPEFEQLLTSLLEAGVNHIHGIEFRTTELRKHRDHARELATRAAHEKAEAMAAAAGRKIGNLQSVTETHQDWYSGYDGGWGHRWSQGNLQNVVQQRSGEASFDETPLAPGQISVRSSVSASYLLE
jgi:uncharacterized protein